MKTGFYQLNNGVWMQRIGLRLRLRLMKEKRKLTSRENTLREALREFQKQNESDRPVLTSIARKRTDVIEEIGQIDLWLAQGQRPLRVAATARGKGVPLPEAIRH